MIASVTGASNRTFTATGLTPGTSYTLEVAAVSSSGSGPYGMVTTVTVPMGVLTTYHLLNEISRIIF